MIILQCLEKKWENNPYSIETISLWKEKNDYYAAFTCSTQERYEMLLLKVKMLLFHERAESYQLSFLLINSTQKNTLLMKGNISKAIELFISEKILKSANQQLFTDLEEEEVQTFLKASAKVCPYVKQGIKKVMVAKEENIENTQKSRRCIIL